MSEQQLLRLKDAAKLKNMSSPKFTYYMKKGRVPGEVIYGGVKFFDAAILAAWEPEDRRKCKKSKIANESIKQEEISSESLCETPVNI